jgi:hypothetical protein
LVDATGLPLPSLICIVASCDPGSV